jgi:Skp family chaperone for outer membrane proteins
MKHIVNAKKAIASVGVMVVFCGIGYAQCKIAVVDMLAAVAGSNEGKAQGPKFDARVREWMAKLDIIQSEISKTQKQLNGQAARSPDDSDAVLKRRIQEKNGEFTRMQSDAQKDVDNYRDSLLGPLMKVAAETAKTVAAEKGIASVVDSSAPLTAPLPAGGGKDCDITTEVKTRMNARYSVDAPAK